MHVGKYFLSFFATSRFYGFIMSAFLLRSTNLKNFESGTNDPPVRHIIDIRIYKDIQ